MKLKDIREEISSIDMQILDLIEKRFEFIPKLVEEKKREKIPAFQPARENQMHGLYWSSAIKKRINPELIRKIFDLIITEMRELQEIRLESNE